VPTSTVIPEQDVEGTGAASRATPGPDIADLDATRLVRRAASGDPQAWEGLVGRYGRLIWSITRDFKLVESDAADVFQTTWMRLIEHIDRIDHPDRVGSWLAATARNECLRSLAAHKRVVLAHDDDPFDGQASHEPEVDEALLAAERAKVVREAMTQLPRRWQRLMEMLMADPPASYAEISDELGLPVGSIGPTRGRCLARLRVLLEASLGGAERVGVYPAAAARLDFRVGGASLGHQVRDEERYLIRVTRDELVRADHRNRGPRHAQSALGRGGVRHRGQHFPVDPRLAEQRDSARGGTVAEHGLARGRALGKPVVQGGGAVPDLPL
jgi:RNA polymerase sigma factor (sigma-70 family)